jgi:hypothetical protein
MTNIHKVLSRRLSLQGQSGAVPLFTTVISAFYSSSAQRHSFGHYLAEMFMIASVFTTQRVFIALEMGQGHAGGVGYLFI